LNVFGNGTIATYNDPTNMPIKSKGVSPHIRRHESILGLVNDNGGRIRPGNMEEIDFLV
jgi:hypothetical protein